MPEETREARVEEGRGATTQTCGECRGERVEARDRKEWHRTLQKREHTNVVALKSGREWNGGGRGTPETEVAEASGKSPCKPGAWPARRALTVRLELRENPNTEVSRDTPKGKPGERGEARGEQCTMSIAREQNQANVKKSMGMPPQTGGGLPREKLHEWSGDTQSVHPLRNRRGNVHSPYTWARVKDLDPKQKQQGSLAASNRVFTEDPRRVVELPGHRRLEAECPGGDPRRGAKETGRQEARAGLVVEAPKNSSPSLEPPRGDQGAQTKPQTIRRREQPRHRGLYPRGDRPI